MATFWKAIVRFVYPWLLDMTSPLEHHEYIKLGFERLYIHISHFPKMLHWSQTTKKAHASWIAPSLPYMTILFLSNDADIGAGCIVKCFTNNKNIQLI